MDEINGYMVKIWVGVGVHLCLVLMLCLLLLMCLLVLLEGGTLQWSCTRLVMLTAKNTF